MVPVGFVLMLVRAAFSAGAKSKQGSPAGLSSQSTQVTSAGLGVFLLYLFYVLFVYPMALIPTSRFLDASSFPEEMKKWGFPFVAVASLYAVTVFPRWLAWRVLGPTRIAPLGESALILSLFLRHRDRRGACELYKARFTRKWDRRRPATSPWTIAAAALQAEREGDPARADALFGLLGRSSRKVRFPRRARVLAAESLAASAARRGEWERVRTYAANGGRMARFLSRLAAVHLGQPVAKPILLLTWAMAPGRIAAFPLLRNALAILSSPTPELQVPTDEPGEPILQGDGRSVPLAHLRLLARVASGRPVTTGEVESLARAWDAELSPAAGAHLVRRALALGGQNLADLPQMFRESIFAELKILAEVAQGTWSGAQEAGGENDPAAPLARRRVHRAFEDVREEVDAFGRRAEPEAKCRPFATPMEELERWLGFRARVERLERVGGETALQTAWHNGLRVTVCNWPIYLSHQRDADANASWAVFLMDGWSIELAKRMGDEQIVDFSSKNAERVKRSLT